MSSMKSFVLALSFLFTGCAAQAAGDGASLEGDLETGAVGPGSFKLYDAPNSEASAECDVHTVLQFSVLGATLREAVTGTCDMAITPNARSYALTLADEPCGSKVYTGTARVGTETRSITLTDHRTRVCRDLPPARIVVEESDGVKGSVTLYGEN